MKSTVAITLIIVGALLVMAPFTYNFILAALDEHQVLDSSARMTCTVLGTVMIVLGAVFSFIARPAASK